LDLQTDQPSLALVSNPHRPKRKFHETGFEIADSEGEDYGWEDDDEAEMPSMPPQWQGSEDLLLGRAEDDDNDNQAVELPEPEGPCQTAGPVISGPGHGQLTHDDLP
jgi:hypothetical protein